LTRLLAIAAAAFALAAPVAHAQSVDDLIARHVAARGGLPALRAIHGVTMSGKMRPPGLDSDIVWIETIRRPGDIRIEGTLQGLTLVQAYDGSNGWEIQPFEGRKDAQAMSADDAKSLQEEADFEGALVDYRAKGNRVAYLGTEDVDGAPAYLIRADLKNGDQQTFYIDPDSMMVIRILTRQIVRGSESQTQADYGDYEKVAGVYFPFEVASGPPRSTDRTRITYDRIVPNPEVNPVIFARPAGPAPAPAAGAR
jgi:hypothetical protein